MALHILDIASKRTSLTPNFASCLVTSVLPTPAGPANGKPPFHMFYIQHSCLHAMTGSIAEPKASMVSSNQKDPHMNDKSRFSPPNPSPFLIYWFWVNMQFLITVALQHFLSKSYVSSIQIQIDAALSFPSISNLKEGST